MHSSEVIKLSDPLPDSAAATAATNYMGFAQASIPAEGSGWVAAPNPQTIGFGGPNASKISEAGGDCFYAVDYTYFQTFVDVPANTTVEDFKIAFSGMDDASRITIFNSANSAGTVVEGSYVLKADAGSAATTTDLKDLLVTGRNRVVITQVDWCPGGNQLESAEVELNGSKVAPVPARPVPATPPPVAAAPSQGVGSGLLLGGEAMIRGSRYSMEGHYLTFQADGNLCVYRSEGDQFVWCINNDPAVRYGEATSATMMADGRLVVADANGGAIWQAPQANAQARSKVVLTSNGAFQILSPANAVLWSSR